MSKHVCPKWCHKCPDMGRDVMPGCWGGVLHNDLHHCTCKRPEKRKEVEEGERTVLGLERRIEQLERDLRSKLVGPREA